MQTTSQNYKTIVSGEYETDVMVNIAGTNYGMSDLLSVKTTLGLFDGNPEIGTCPAGRIDIKMIYPDTSFPRMAAIKLYVRVRNEMLTSEWIQKGVYYIDTRKRSNNVYGENILEITGYDAMLRAEAQYPNTTATWPRQDLPVVNEIAKTMGVEVDSRTTALMSKDYVIQYPAEYSMRETLGYIAAMYGGSFIITETGKLRLVQMFDIPPETRYLITGAGEAITFGGVRILV